MTKIIFKQCFYDTTFLRLNKDLGDKPLSKETKGVTQIEVIKPKVMTIKAPDILVPAKGIIPKPFIAPVSVKTAQPGPSDLPPLPPIPPLQTPASLVDPKTGLLKNPSGHPKITAPVLTNPKGPFSGTTPHKPLAPPLTNYAKGKLDSFMSKALIPRFNLEIVPKIFKGMDCNDDLFLSSFSSSELTWAGAQRMGFIRRY